LIAFDEEIEIEPQSETRKEDMEILFAIHLATSDEKKQYLGNWLRDREQHKQERLYNKTKSKTAAEYNHIKTIGDSLEQKNYRLKHNMKSLLDFIIEAKSITFGGSGATKETYGNCIILAGGPGSGKGFIKSKILCKYKNIDVDELKKSYIALAKAGKIAGDNGDYDLKDPDDVSDIHSKVKKHGWKNKQREAFWNQRAMKDERSSGLLPNILFDMVSGDIKDVEEVVEKAKEMGYSTTIIWVLCNKETASIGNKIRERQVHEKIIDTGHAEAYKTMSDLFSNKYPKVTKLIDRGWIGFSAGYGRYLLPKYEHEPVIKVKKSTDDKFTINKSLVDEFLKDKMPIDYAFVNKKIKSHNDKDAKQVQDWIKVIGKEYQPQNVDESTMNHEENYLEQWNNALQEIL
jgi:predicted kinase